MECFFQAGNNEQLLSCELVVLLGESFAQISYTALARRVLQRCPPETLARHPLSMLRLCLALFAGADFLGFEAALEQSSWASGICCPPSGSFPTFPA